MAEKEVLFSGAFRGYNRRDVNEYIVSENKKFSEIEAGLKEEIEKLKQELVNKEDELTSVRSQLDGLESVISSKESEISEKDKELREARASFDLSVREKDENIKALEERLVSEKISYDAELAKSNEEHRQKLDECVRELDNLKEDYRLREEEKYDDVVRAAYRLRDRMSATLRKYTKECLRDVMRGVREMRSGADLTAQNVEEQNRRMNDSIDTYEIEMKNEVRRIMDEFKNSTPDRSNGR